MTATHSINSCYCTDAMCGVPCICDTMQSFQITWEQDDVVMLMLVTSALLDDQYDTRCCTCHTWVQDQLLKVVPQQQQVQYFAGTPVDLGVRVGTGLVLTIAASKIPVLAAGTLFYPLWWPLYKAWSQNQKLRSSYRYVYCQL